MMRATGNRIGREIVQSVRATHYSRKPYSNTESLHIMCFDTQAGTVGTRTNGD